MTNSLSYYTALFCFCSVCIPFQSFAQIQGERLLRDYQSNAYNEAQRLAGLTESSIYRDIQDNIDQAFRPEDWEEITIPIVFHVLYTEAANRVTNEQIAEQVASLNEDFAAANVPEEDVRDPNSTYRRLATDTKIRFCRPLGGILDGIPVGGIDIRRIAEVDSSQLDLVKTSEIGLPPISPSRFLNIWICPLPAGITGYAQLPGAALSSDGIVIDPAYFGLSGTATAPYQGGKTLTHLIGNYLGLSPIWGDLECSDDGIKDTPSHNAPNYGRPGKNHHSTCPGTPIEMTMNFMDNTDDDYVYMFTRDQARFMHAVLRENGLRSDLGLGNLICTDMLPDLPALRANTVEGSPTSPLIDEVVVYPNPAVTEFYVSFNREDIDSERRPVHLTIYDIQGRLVDRQDGLTWQRTYRINAYGWMPGSYVIKCTMSDGTAISRRLTIQ